MSIFKRNQKTEDATSPSKTRKIVNGLLASGTLGIIISVILWILPSPYERIASKSANNVAEAYRTIQSKYIDISESTPLTEKAQEVRKSQLEIQASLNLLSSYTKHVKEVAKKRYLKSLSTREILTLAQDEYWQRDAILKTIESDIICNIHPYCNEDSSNVIYRMYKPKFQPFLDKYYKEISKYGSEKKELENRLSVYLTPLLNNTSKLYEIKDKPNKELFTLCIDCIVNGTFINSIDTWTQFLQAFQEYLSELKDYYNARS